MKRKQPGANRAHPNPSTGPRSGEGKARSSMNALKSGIYSKSLTIPGEDPAQLTTLTEEYFQRFNPTLPEQRDLVDILVRSTWALRRLAVAETQIYTHEMDSAMHLDEDSPIGHTFWLVDRTLTRLQRMVNSTQRNFRDALRELQRLQAIPPGLDPDPPPVTDISTGSRVPKPSPASAQGPRTTAQPVEIKPVSQSSEFVSSSSTPPPTAAQKPASSPKPLPFHQPGSHCDYNPSVPSEFKRCPICFPED